MSAIAFFMLEAGTSTVSCFASFAFLIRVSISAITSEICIVIFLLNASFREACVRFALPAGFFPAACRRLKLFTFLPTRWSVYRVITSLTSLRRVFSTLISKLTEADSANAVFTEICVRSAADFASRVFSCGILLRLLLFEF